MHAFEDIGGIFSLFHDFLVAYNFRRLSDDTKRHDEEHTF